MSLLIGFLTFILVVNCVFLMLLVLVQLPKKEAGAGLAFGAGAVDTLIGAGSGNALTKMTKYSAGIFLALAVVIAILNSQRHGSSTDLLREELSRKTTTTTAPGLPVAQPATPATPASSGTLPVPSGNQAAPVNPAGTAPIQLTPTAVPQQGAAPTPATPGNAAPVGSQNTATPGAANTPPANTGSKQP